MDSFFFNITERRYKITELFRQKEEYLRRVDISNGIVFVECKLSQSTQTFQLQNLDRMVMVVMVKKGMIFIEDHLTQKTEQITEGKIAIYCSSRQDLILTVPKSDASDIFVLFISDFFLKRYLSGEKNEPIDYLYDKIQEEISLEKIHTLPTDALSLYMVEKILNVPSSDMMQSIRAEQRVTEFMIHRFSLLDIFDEVDEEALALASRAKAVLLEDFKHPPTVSELAHLCATNESKLKIVFKQVYKTTIHAYVQKLRLEEANLLMKEENLTIGEIASRVGYRHQGHFSKLFFAAYGVYPKELIKA